MSFWSCLRAFLRCTRVSPHFGFSPPKGHHFGLLTMREVDGGHVFSEQMGVGLEVEELAPLLLLYA